MHTGKVMAKVENHCSGCGGCLSSCPVKSITLQTELADGSGRKRAVINEEPCLGCGVCVADCRLSALSMRCRPGQTP